METPFLSNEKKFELWQSLPAVLSSATNGLVKAVQPSPGESRQSGYKTVEKLWILQKAAQPDGTAGCGIIFRDSGGSTAASLIEQAGLKGTQVGEAKVNERHANFIEVEPGGSSRDVIRLIDLLKTRVSEQLGVELELDVEIW